MIEIFVHIENGKSLVLDNYLRDVENGKYKVTIEKGKRRSLNQNAYYHGVICTMVKEILRDAGYNEIKSGADAHEILKYKFLKKQIPNEHGEYVEMVGSTHALSTVEFMAYIEEIVQWVAETFHVVIPAPGQQATIF